jgi:GT2 family glycosyltransferase
MSKRIFRYVVKNYKPILSQLTFKNLRILIKAIFSEDKQTILKNLNNKIQDTKKATHSISNDHAIEVFRLKSGRIHMYYFVEGYIKMDEPPTHVTLHLGEKKYSLAFEKESDLFHFKSITQLDQNIESLHPGLKITCSDNSLELKLETFELPDNNILTSQQLYDYYISLEEKFTSTYKYNKDNDSPNFAIILFGNDKHKLDITRQSINNLRYTKSKVNIITYEDSESLKQYVEENVSDYIICLTQGDTLHSLSLLELDVFLRQKEFSYDLIFTDYDILDNTHKRANPQRLAGYGSEILNENTVLSKSMILSKDAFIENIDKFIVQYTLGNPQDLSSLHSSSVIHFPRITRHLSSQYSQSIQTRKDKKVYIANKAVNASVTIIIPFKDEVDILKQCMDSIKLNTLHQHYDILLINNQSKDEATIRYLDKVRAAYTNVEILDYKKPFNYSSINNYAVSQTGSDYVLFLNNDTEIMTTGWMQQLLSQAIRENIGAVGPTLVYPNNKIQQQGIRLIQSDYAQHTPQTAYVSHGIELNKGLTDFINPVAITAACLLVKKSLFDDVGGFNESDLAISFNDIDLCLKLYEAGYSSLVVPKTVVLHHESYTRKTSKTRSKQEKKEFEYLHKKWKSYFINETRLFGDQ